MLLHGVNDFLCLFLQPKIDLLHDVPFLQRYRMYFILCTPHPKAPSPHLVG